MIEFDVETTGLQPWSQRNEAFLWIFSDGTNHEAIPFLPSGKDLPSWRRPGEPLDAALLNGENAQERIQAWFDRGKVEGIRAWNAKFDRAFAEASAAFDVPGDGLWYDGMVMAHAIDERRSVALKAVASQLFGEEAADAQKELKTWLNKENARRRKEAKDNGTHYEPANYSHVPHEIMNPYGVEDVVLTRKVCNVYEPRLEQASDLAGLVEFERKAMDALYAIEKRGLPAQEQNYRKLEMEVVANIEKLSARVAAIVEQGDPVAYAKALAGKDWHPEKEWVEVSEDGLIKSYSGGAARLDEFNPNSTQQILAALKARGADMSYMSEVNGKLSADADNLRAVDDELAVAILDFRAERQVHSTYVKPMIDRSYVSAMNTYKEPFIAPDGRIHATYRQVGARTGRMSCADPNMQNQPRDDLRLRYNIEAEPGHVLVTCDLTNIEMVLFAAYCGEGRLLNAVRNGEDLHVLTAQMLGLRDRARPGGGVESARQLGKVYNFSRIYGGGLRTIRRSFRCSMDHARLLKRRFDDAYPEVGRLATRIQCRLEDDGYIQAGLISGRHFRVDPRDAYKATNYLVQGTAADVLKDAVISLHADGVPMVALVHDEILAHVPVEDAKEVAHLIEKRMTQAAAPGGPLWLDERQVPKTVAGPDGPVQIMETLPAGPLVPLHAEADIVERWSDAKPLKDENGRLYHFTPKWAGGERRYLDAA